MVSSTRMPAFRTLPLRRSPTAQRVPRLFPVFLAFTDVNPSSAFYREILWSTQQYVINPDFGAFNATDLVNRGQLEQMLFNFQNRAK